jgi:hypothetical protein
MYQWLLYVPLTIKLNILHRSQVFNLAQHTRILSFTKINPSVFIKQAHYD